jgi:hypothetical protein
VRDRSGQANARRTAKAESSLPRGYRAVLRQITSISTFYAVRSRLQGYEADGAVAVTKKAATPGEHVADC